MAAVMLAGDGSLRAHRGGEMHQAAGFQEAPASDVLPGEWMVPRPTAEVDAAVRQVLNARGMRVAEEDPEAGVVITASLPYRPEWPAAEALRLSVLHTPRRVTFHVRVARDLEPARLAVGVILETDYAHIPLRASKWKGGSTFYGQRELGYMFVDWLSKSLGVDAVPLPSDATERAALARRLLPGAAEACAGTPAAVLSSGATPTRPIAAPKYKVRPEYPRQELALRLVGSVTMRGEVTEQGTYTKLEQVGGVEEPNLVAAAVGAAGIWAFRPPLLGKCPMRQTVTLEIAFIVR
jgi:TonB family protein